MLTALSLSLSFSISLSRSRSVSLSLPRSLINPFPTAPSQKLLNATSFFNLFSIIIFCISFVNLSITTAEGFVSGFSGVSKCVCMWPWALEVGVGGGWMECSSVCSIRNTTYQDKYQPERIIITEKYSLTFPISSPNQSPQPLHKTRTHHVHFPPPQTQPPENPPNPT